MSTTFSRSDIQFIAEGFYIGMDGEAEVWRQLSSPQCHLQCTTSSTEQVGKVQVSENDLRVGNPSSPDLKVLRLEHGDAKIVFFVQIELKNGEWVPWAPAEDPPPPVSAALIAIVRGVSW